MKAETQWIQENLVVMPRTVDELAKVLNWHLKERVEAINDEIKYLQNESQEAITGFTALKIKYPRIATIDVIKLIERLKLKLDNLEQLLKQ